MADLRDPKAVLHHYLQVARDDLIWKLDGLSEREARLPRTATGNNLLGVLKHCLNVEAGYFGPTFGREFPAPDELVPLQVYEDDPQADWYALEGETKEGLIGLYRRVAVFADQTIEEVSRNMGDVQVRRMPVVDRQKRLVGIISLSDIACGDGAIDDAGEALRDISQPGGEHSQTAAH